MFFVAELGRGLARRAKSDEEWQVVARCRRYAWYMILALTAIVSVANGVALLHLVQALLSGVLLSGKLLLIDALNVWSTNVIMFALWYWALDRGGPAMRALDRGGSPEFTFPRSDPAPEDDRENALPGFVDYLFLSFTTSTAFSPADTVPTSRRMKLLMMAEAMISLLTIALVAARAVNILA
jgi:uncharacterized membrane protein